MSKVAFLALLGLFSTGNAAPTFIDFNDAGPPLAPVPDMTVAGVAISFGNLIVVDVGSNADVGFAGNGPNQVYSEVNDLLYFNGRFITAEGQPQQQLRPADFTRSILFDTPVSNLGMWIADIDSSAGALVGNVAIEVFVEDALGQVLDSRTYLSDLNLDGHVLNSDFEGIGGIRAVRIIGGDPIGIDSLYFDTDVALVSLPGTWVHLAFALSFLGFFKRTPKLPV